MRWVKFSERFPGSKDQASLDIGDDVIVRSDDIFLIRNFFELRDVVSLDDYWLEIIEAEPVRACSHCQFYDGIYCRKPLPEPGAINARWPSVKRNDWCSHFDPK